MRKEDIRRDVLKKRRALTETNVNELSEQIFNRVRSLDLWSKHTFHVFLPIERNKEVNTWPMIHFLKDELQKQVVLSKTNFKDISLEHIRYDSDTELYKTKFGIPEPIRGITVDEDDIEVVFVPLLAFDNQGNRVGYGKGFYDIFLAKCNPNTITVGLSLFNDPIEIDDVNEQDFPLDYCVTPNEVKVF